MNKSCTFLSRLAVALSAFTISLTVLAQGQTETVLYSFANNANGYNPVGSLVFDSAGNLYGTTSEGGNFAGCSTGCGVVFELSPGSDGTWSENVPHTFTGGTDGANPFVGLVADGKGNFYGTTGDGGNSEIGAGTIYKLSPKSGGGWTTTLVHLFSGGADGGNPYTNLIIDSSGNLYGTAHRGGAGTCGCGLVFKMSPTANGSWTESVLQVFNSRNGSFPEGSLVFDSEGNLWSTTAFGGVTLTLKGYERCLIGQSFCGYGTVFELSPTAKGLWRETLVYLFKHASDGANPAAGLVADSAGNFYGTTQIGGTPDGCDVGGCGVVFELSPSRSGLWLETPLYAFSNSDGAFPFAPLVFDGGNLYGTTNQGGTSNCGVVFKLVPTQSGWSESTVYDFNCSDGGQPDSQLINDGSGNLYGTAPIGGANGVGVVFEITPVARGWR